MATMMCIACSVEFPSDAVYLKHKKSGHALMDQATPIGEVATPTPPPGVPATAMPSPEFIEQVKRIEQEKEKPAESHSTASQHPSELPAAQPLILTYKYVGECPEHRNPVDTLELDVAKEHFCVAYCPSGKHQVETKGVTKL